MRSATLPLKEVAKRSGATTFRQLANEKLGMYNAVLAVCCGSLQSWTTSRGGSACANLFRFLVGADFYKVVITELGVQVQDFGDVQEPTAVTCAVVKSRLQLTFDNGWTISLRIHTAASRLTTDPECQLSLKFDAQLADGGPTANNIGPSSSA